MIRTAKPYSIESRCFWSYTVTVRFGRLSSRPSRGFSASAALATKLTLPLVLADPVAHPVVGYSGCQDNIFTHPRVYETYLVYVPDHRLDVGAALLGWAMVLGREVVQELVPDRLARVHPFENVWVRCGARLG